MANSKLPRDAEGREIPLDTECLYTHDGEKQSVLSFTYYREKDRWEIETDTYIVHSIYLYITPPDSWEKLLADLKRGANRVHHPECAYFGMDENDCDQCEAVCSFACKKIAFGDIESRIRKLMGEDQ